ncbi:MAG TPA: hypothetical protein VFB66_06055 [Tepidisphaeraceae bacterium]|nr:hypothetical protein [Tepidisphaeraceae bacterium]
MSPQTACPNIPPCRWSNASSPPTASCGWPPKAAVRAFAEDVLSSRRVIVVSRVDGRVADVWVTDDPLRDETKYALPGETIEKRYWDGRAATP